MNGKTDLGTILYMYWRIKKLLKEKIKNGGFQVIYAWLFQKGVLLTNSYLHPQWTESKP